MSDPDPRDLLAQPVRVLQIIVAAVLFGVIALLAVILSEGLAGMSAEDPKGTGSLITYLALGYSAAAVVVCLVLPGIIVRAGRRKMLREPAARPAYAEDENTMPHPHQKTDDEVFGKLLRLFHVKTIISAAILEGMALFLLVAYMIEGKPTALAAAIVLTVGIALQFPTCSRAADWIDAQRRRLHAERTAGG
ncbi:MAG: hypothetical protein JXQ73_09385 [Phycisphaerae bacterium]|nr:hypothetical protein [Phycisphaerae bacterium]